MAFITVLAPRCDVKGLVKGPLPRDGRKRTVEAPTQQFWLPHVEPKVPVLVPPPAHATVFTPNALDARRSVKHAPTQHTPTQHATTLPRAGRFGKDCVCRLRCFDRA